MTPEELDALCERLRSAKANGDPAKYIAGISVEEAHATAAAIGQLQRERDEVRGLLHWLVHVWPSAAAIRGEQQ